VATDFVGAQHEFHSKAFALGWADRFVPTPERMRLFGLIFSQLNDAITPDGNIIELGLGPGYLAQYLLDRMPDVSYCGIDFSLPMIEIAQQRLHEYSSRVTYTQADLVKEAWEKNISNPAHAIVSTWALHDLGSPENISTVYERSYNALDSNGILLNGDFVKPTGAAQEFEGGRLYVAKHLELLGTIGFSNVRCLSLFEEEIENPTPAQNYACIRAQK
jgi:cyclopropane fatty-acyl-phospholipid synthase-like methyltransferase